MFGLKSQQDTHTPFFENSEHIPSLFDSQNIEEPSAFDIFNSDTDRHQVKSKKSIINELDQFNPYQAINQAIQTSQMHKSTHNFFQFDQSHQENSSVPFQLRSHEFQSNGRFSFDNKLNKKEEQVEQQKKNFNYNKEIQKSFQLKEKKAQIKQNEKVKPQLKLTDFKLRSNDRNSNYSQQKHLLMKQKKQQNLVKNMKIQLEKPSEKTAQLPQPAKKIDFKQLLRGSRAKQSNKQIHKPFEQFLSKQKQSRLLFNFEHSLKNSRVLSQCDSKQKSSNICSIKQSPINAVKQNQQSCKSIALNFRSKQQKAQKEPKLISNKITQKQQNIPNSYSLKISKLNSKCKNIEFSKDKVQIDETHKKKLFQVKDTLLKKSEAKTSQKQSQQKKNLIFLAKEKDQQISISTQVHNSKHSDKFKQKFKMGIKQQLQKKQRKQQQKSNKVFLLKPRQSVEKLLIHKNQEACIPKKSNFNLFKNQSIHTENKQQKRTQPQAVKGCFKYLIFLEQTQKQIYIAKQKQNQLKSQLRDSVVQANTITRLLKQNYKDCYS